MLNTFLLFFFQLIKTNEKTSYEVENFKFIKEGTSKKEIIKTLGKGLEIKNLPFNYILYPCVNEELNENVIVLIKFSNNSVTAIVNEIKFINVEKEFAISVVEINQGKFDPELVFNEIKTIISNN